MRWERHSRRGNNHTRVPTALRGRRPAATWSTAEMARGGAQSASRKRRVIGRPRLTAGGRNQLPPSLSRCDIQSPRLQPSSQTRPHRRHGVMKGGTVVQSSPTTDEVFTSIDLRAWHATRWVGAVAGHATGRDLLTNAWISADQRKSVTRVYAAACADLAQATLGGLPSRSSRWERWFTDLRSTARDLSPARGNPHPRMRYGARAQRRGATLVS